MSAVAAAEHNVYCCFAGVTAALIGNSLLLTVHAKGRGLAAGGSVAVADYGSLTANYGSVIYRLTVCNGSEVYGLRVHRSILRIYGRGIYRRSSLSRLGSGSLCRSVGRGGFSTLDLLTCLSQRFSLILASSSFILASLLLLLASGAVAVIMYVCNGRIVVCNRGRRLSTCYGSRGRCRYGSLGSRLNYVSGACINDGIVNHLGVLLIELIIVVNLYVEEVKDLGAGRNKELSSGLIGVLAHKNGRLNGIADSEHFSEGGNLDDLISRNVESADNLLNEGAIVADKSLYLCIISDVLILGEIHTNKKINEQGGGYDSESLCSVKKINKLALVLAVKNLTVTAV